MHRRAPAGFPWLGPFFLSCFGALRHGAERFVGMKLAGTALGLRLVFPEAFKPVRRQSRQTGLSFSYGAGAHSPRDQFCLSAFRPTPLAAFVSFPDARIVVRRLLQAAHLAHSGKGGAVPAGALDRSARSCTLPKIKRGIVCHRPPMRADISAPMAAARTHHARS
jgi:hypothetical protein